MTDLTIPQAAALDPKAHAALPASSTGSPSPAALESLARYLLTRVLADRRRPALQLVHGHTSAADDQAH